MNMLKRDIKILENKREELRQKYNKDRSNKNVRKELLKVNRIIQRNK